MASKLGARIAMVAAGLAVAGITASASPANAASPQGQNGERASCSDTRIYLNDDWGCVISHGDHLQISDQTWDGNGARLHWRSTSPNEHGKEAGYCKDYNGSENGYEDCNFNFKEGTGITYRLEQIDGGEVVDANETWRYVEV